MRFLPIVISAATLALFAGAVSAHPKLLSSTPSANVTVMKPTRVVLKFSEKLMPAFSQGEVNMAASPGMKAMPGMAAMPKMAAMKIASTSALSADGHSLMITPKAPLSPGRYSVSWHVVSTDTHKVDGTYAFAVK